MKAWIVASLAALMILSALNVIAVARRVPPPPRAPLARPENIVLRHEQRFAPLRRALEQRVPPGVVGYVADLPPERIAGDAAAMQEYFLTQFALAPWIIDARAQGLRWAVANFHDANPGRRLPPGFRIAGDFGEGVLLLEKEP